MSIIRTFGYVWDILKAYLTPDSPLDTKNPTNTNVTVHIQMEVLNKSAFKKVLAGGTPFSARKRSVRDPITDCLTDAVQYSLTPKTLST